MYFDCLVNNYYTAGWILQAAINNIIKNNGEHEQMIEDGIVGKITLSYAEKFSTSLKNQFMIECIHHYLSLANRGKLQDSLCAVLNRLFTIYETE